MKFRRFAASLVLGLLILLGNAAPVQAANNNGGNNNSGSKQSSSSSPSASPNPSNVVQTGNGNVGLYDADSVLQIGTIVQLAQAPKAKGKNATPTPTPKATSKVQPVSTKNIKSMYGIVVDPHMLHFTITDPKLKNPTWVATSGTWNVLVCNQDGPIKTDDYITLAAITGVGTNAGQDNNLLVLGRAVGSFDGKSNTLGSVQLKTTGGGDFKKVNLGMLPLSIQIQTNPNRVTIPSKVPKALQKIAKAIAQRQVSGGRLYLSAGISFITIFFAMAMLYAAVRSSLISVGRNPLSKKAIFRGLLEVVLSSTLIVIIGLFAVYLILKL
jgi:hypothetical protein